MSGNFTEGKILSPLVRFMLPIVGALFLQAMYGAVDLMVVGLFGDASSLSAVSTGSSIIQMVTMFVSGLTMGTTILIGRHIGENDPKRAGKTVGAAICLFVVVAVVVSVLMFALVMPLTQVMQVPEEAIGQCVSYLQICGAGMIFVTAYNVISGIFRGIGNSKLPLIFVAIACVVNIIGDLLLVGVFHMDVAGAALATIAAQAVSVILSLVIIKRTGLPFEFNKKMIRFHKHEIKSMLMLGLPIALQDTLTSLSFVLVNSMVNSLGLLSSAGYGIASKVINFIMLIPSAFMQAMSAFVAQNIGAAKPERAKKALFLGMGTALCVGTVMFLIGCFGGSLLSAIFSTDAQVIAASASYLRSFSLDCIITCVLFCFMGYFNGCGRTKFVMIQGLIGAFGVRIPLSYLICRTVGSLFLMGFATPAASLVSGIICIFYYRYLRNKE
ncbi:MAG TPA: MATE family efflux transporter [Candidatus Scybalocola faecigallinarum]|uniref:MATE family efflux transporter n=1 Tax=Candidatus Scybalocola faecigallinarum TaxID=2840941 RepID=A0A9D1JPK1_9FIRM|nr:MATE family efflux transporter [Candidatus Scybalocola faecigallinarum]